MNCIRIKKYTLQISVLLFFLVCIFSLSHEVKGAPEVEKSKKNLFYVHLLNYGMPSVKVSTFDGDELAENQFSLKQNMLRLLGIDFKEPISIFSKEISCLNMPYKEEVKTQYIENTFNPYKLSETEISRNPINISPKEPVGEDLILHNATLKKPLNSGKPEVFIYHTHTCESYSPGKPDNADQTQNVVSVGDKLAIELEKNYGIATVHDKTVHDAYAYTQSYARSSDTVDKYLKQYGDFRLIIDLHRDSIPDKKSVTVKLNGENTATFMLVMSKKNAHFDKNDAVAKKIVETSNRLFPKLCKGIYYYNTGVRGFNQGKSNNAILIEVGSDINTTAEAQNTAKYLSRILAEYLNGKN